MKGFHIDDHSPGLDAILVDSLFSLLRTLTLYHASMHVCFKTASQFRFRFRFCCSRMRRINSSHFRLYSSDLLSFRRCCLICAISLVIFVCFYPVYWTPFAFASVFALPFMLYLTTPSLSSSTSIPHQVPSARHTRPNRRASLSSFTCLPRLPRSSSQSSVFSSPF